MADVKRCDRCGKYYLKNDTLVESTNPNLKADKKECLTDLIVKTDSQISRVYYDLCDVCWHLFFRFMNNETVEGDERLV